MSEDQKPLSALLAELLAAHKASLTNNPKAVTAWSMMIDREARRLFEEIAILQHGLDGTALIVQQKEVEIEDLKRLKLEADARCSRVMNADNAKDLAHKAELKTRDDTLKELTTRLEEQIKKTEVRYKQMAEDMTKLTLINRELASKLRLYAPGGIKHGSLDSAPTPSNGDHPPLFMPALTQKFGIFAELAMESARPDLFPSNPKLPHE